MKEMKNMEKTTKSNVKADKQEKEERLRSVIKKWVDNRNDPFFITEKGKEIAKRFKAIEKIMES